MSKNANLPSGIIGLILIVFIFLYQRKQNRQTLSLVQHCLTRLELVESETEQLVQQNSFSHTGILKDKVKRVGKEVQKLKVILNSFQQQPQPIVAKSERTVAFIDAANIEIAARQQGLKIDFNKLKEELTDKAEGEIELLYYTAVDARCPKQVNFVKRQERRGYKVITKKLVRHADGTVEGNVDPEIMRDLMDLSASYDTAILLSADGDFNCIVECLQEKQKRVEVVSFASVNQELKELADKFTDITTLPIFSYKKPHKKVIRPKLPKFDAA